MLRTLPSEVAHHRQQYRSAHTQIPCMDNMCATIDHCFTPPFFFNAMWQGRTFIYLIIVVIVFYLVVLFCFIYYYFFLILWAGEAWTPPSPVCPFMLCMEFMCAGRQFDSANALFCNSFHWYITLDGNGVSSINQQFFSARKLSIELLNHSFRNPNHIFSFC